jgi:anti-sigma regulatory factor (Ser/Thr protein kinase)
MSPSHPRAWAEEITLPPVALSVQRARTFVADHLAAHDADVETEDICLVASELASNALVHARTPFTVFLRADPVGISLSVKDGLSTFVRRPGPSGGLDDGGRGLLITEELSDAWGIRSGAYGSKYVWTFFAHGGSTRPGFLPRRGRREPGEPAALCGGQGRSRPVADC